MYDKNIHKFIQKIKKSFHINLIPLTYIYCPVRNVKKNYV
jgi:hypothetical protein